MLGNDILIAMEAAGEIDLAWWFDKTEEEQQ